MSAQDAINELSARHAAALTQQAAHAEAAAAAAPPPPRDLGFSQGCDRLGCSSGLVGWVRAAGAQPPRIQSCGGCGEARYCSKECQRADWRGGHRAFCSTLRPPPRPLRLLQRLVSCSALEPLLPPSWFKDAPPLAGGMSVGFSWGGKEKEEGALAALLARLAPRRLIVAAQHCWAYCSLGPGEAQPPVVTLFEHDVSSSPATAQRLLAACQQVMPYLFREEDRLAKGVRYAPSTGNPKLGHPCPPRTALVLGAQVNASSTVISEGYMGLGGLMGMGGSSIILGSPRWRWETKGPFSCGEMALEDISMKSLDFYHPPTWPEGWLLVGIKFQA